MNAGVGAYGQAQGHSQGWSSVGGTRPVRKTAYIGGSATSGELGQPWPVAAIGADGGGGECSTSE